MSAELITLRSYQRESLDAVYEAWMNGTQKPAVVLPTGAGKTVIFTHLAKEELESSGERVLILVHRDELADQTLAKLRQEAPHLTIGKVKAQDNDVMADVMVASVQTLSRDRRLNMLLTAPAKPIGCIITDECHHAAALSYKKIYGALPLTRQVGFTATLARGDGVGLGSTWDDVVYSKSVLWMIAHGYLVDVRGKAINMAGLDLKSVKTTGGDFQTGALGAAFTEAEGPELVARMLKTHAPDRRTIVFTPTVAAAQEVSEELAKAGFSPGVISGKVPREERHRIYEDFRTGKINVLSSCMVLTEGFDAPWADCAVIARPTKSAPLYIQMVGRVLRPSPATGKKDALVLDISGSDCRISTLLDLAPGEITKLEDEESLAEAVIREEEEGGRTVKAGSVAFELKFRDLDLFTASTQSWLRTYGGVLFIPCGGNEGQVLLWPAGEGLWDVAHAPKYGKWSRLHKGLPLGMAQAWAETEADMLAPYNTKKDARWRTNKAERRQVVAARSMGLDPGPDPRRGELGNRMAIHEASEKIDRHIRKAPK